MTATRLPYTRPLLAFILLAYLVLASAYAICTPAWQAPDEPAHFNYVRYIVEHGALPELRAGDWPVEYLEAAKAARFSVDYPIDSIRYESHQPPLYYLLAAPAFALGRAIGFETSLLPVRLYSVLVGLASLLVTWGLLGALLPNRPALRLGSLAFIALLPMHLAMMGSVNNDGLTELMVALTAWQLVLVGRSGWSLRRSLLLGLTIGLCFLTKLQAYIAAPLAFLAWAWAGAAACREHRPLRPLLLYGVVTLLLALAVVAPWLARNAAVYGSGDLLGMVRHDAVAGAQMTTAQMVTERGLYGTAKALVQTTFQSFWGQFGWMGVPLQPRVYQALAALSGLALLGLLARARDLWALRRDAWGVYRLALLAAWGALTVAGYLWYNLQYVQHQGRYLFPAIAVGALGFTAGLQRLFARAPRWVLGLLALAALGLVGFGLARGDLPVFALFLVAASGAAIVVGHQIERRRPGVPLALTYGGMAAFAAWCLTVLVPALTP